jgi:hypothetical protein
MFHIHTSRVLGFLTLTVHLDHYPESLRSLYALYCGSRISATLRVIKSSYGHIRKMKLQSDFYDAISSPESCKSSAFSGSTLRHVFQETGTKMTVLCVTCTWTSTHSHYSRLHFKNYLLLSN